MSGGDENVRFELKLTRGGPPTGAQAAPVNEQRRHDQETGRREANKYAEEALHRVLAIMRQSPDENMVMKCAKMIMDRAWGQTKALTEEEKKGADAGSILDILASVSVTQTQIENEARGHAIKQLDAIEGESTVLDAESFLAEVERERDL
jgi:hypothetical protein